MKPALAHFFQFGLYIFGYLCLTSKITLAQVTSDNTVNTTVNQNGNVAEINGGKTRGDSLFHSFKEFSVVSGNEAFFNNAADISNIFSRVTGGKISNIDGLIRANGSASLFLINPAGIILGEGASLDIGGSFYGGSANSLLFEEGEFSATDLDNPPLLTVNAPIGLSFRDNPGEIKLENSDLKVNAGQNFTLLGGNLNLVGGKITAPGGVINLGGLSTAGTVNIELDNNFRFSDNTPKANVLLNDNAVVSTVSGGGGLITVNANDLKLTNTSLLLAGIGEGMGSENAVAGTIEINTTRIFANDNSQLRADNSGIGKAGTINIITDDLDFAGGSAIEVSTFGQGDAGAVNINAQDISFDQEWSGIYSSVGLKRIETNRAAFSFDAVGNAGEINLNTGTLSLTNGARISSSTIAQGNAGTVNINATGAVSFVGQGDSFVEDFDGPAISSAISQVRKEGAGNGGEVNIKAGSLTLTDKGAVIINNVGQEGNAGDTTIDVAGKVFLDEIGLILSQVTGEKSQGNGGNISITAGSFQAQEGSLILADNLGTGSGGNININADEAISLSDGVLISTENSGRGGDISLTAERLNLTNQTRILANTNGQSETLDNVEDTAGDIKIEVTGDINLDNDNIIQTQLLGEGTGNAGNIEITAGGSLFSTKGNLILADSKAIGNGGNITVTAEERITLRGFTEQGFPSQIFAGLGEDAQGTAGDIEINASEVVLKDAAFIAANNNAKSIGSPGGITVNVDRLRLSENGFINTFTNNNFDSGAININAQTLDLLSGGKIIAATNGAGNGGNINLNIDEQITIDNSIASSAPFVDFGSSLQLLNELQDSPSGVFANATANATGNGGSINVGLEQQPNTFSLSNDAEIRVDSLGTGEGGNIMINSNSLSLDNSRLFAATASKLGGGINLNIDESIVLNGNSLISAEAASNASGGNINIDTNFIVAFPNGNNDIIANAQQGQGGNINIDAESIFGIAEQPLNDLTNDINASSESNLDGIVSITTPEVDALQGAVELPSKIIAPEQTTTQACQANRKLEAESSLIVNGRGGMPPTPDSVLNSANISINEENTNNAQSNSPQAIATSQGYITPARGIVKTADGKIMLSSYPTDKHGERIYAPSANCG